MTLTFTVFTATYNRAHTLGRVYESLRQQTFRDFEWLIVDDGSTDRTHALVEGWQAAGEFPIRYVSQDNAGKPSAFNRGVQEARGELFLNLDSDDACVPAALERFWHHWAAIPEERRGGFTGVTGLCQDQHGDLHSGRFPQDVLDSDSLELRFLHKTPGDKWGFHRTEVLRAHPFPVLEGSRFVSEGVVWFAIARKYKTRFVNEALRVYHIGDGATDHLSSLSQGVLRGRLAYHEMTLNELSDWLPRSPGEFVKSAVAYSRYAFGLGHGGLKQLREIRPLASKLLLLASLAPGYAFARRDRKAMNQ